MLLEVIRGRRARWPKVVGKGGGRPVHQEHKLRSIQPQLPCTA